MNQSNGWIAAPDRDLDGLYDLNVLYEWAVETNNNTVVRYQVLYVQIQYTAGCNTDYLWVRYPFHCENTVMHLSEVKRKKLKFSDDF